jgi:ABC-type phosphate transport system substrate-binding protein
MVPAMSSCANLTPGLSIVTHLVSGSQVQPSEGAVLLRWGAPPELADYSAQLAENRLVMIVNPKNPLTSLTPALIRQIAEGKISNWNAAFQQCPDCFDSQPSEELGNLPPVLNFYQAGEEVQDIFERQILAGTPVARAAATLIPSSLSMQQEVGQDIAAIGYIPSGAVDNSVKAITITGLEETQLSMPILAISLSEPQGAIREWLLCIQQSF